MSGRLLVLASLSITAIMMQSLASVMPKYLADLRKTRLHLLFSPRAEIRRYCEQGQAFSHGSYGPYTSTLPDPLKPPTVEPAAWGFNCWQELNWVTTDLPLSLEHEKNRHAENPSPAKSKATLCNLPLPVPLPQHRYEIRLICGLSTPSKQCYKLSLLRIRVVR